MRANRIDINNAYSAPKMRKGFTLNDTPLFSNEKLLNGSSLKQEFSRLNGYKPPLEVRIVGSLYKDVEHSVLSVLQKTPPQDMVSLSVEHRFHSTRSRHINLIDDAGSLLRLFDEKHVLEGYAPLNSTHFLLVILESEAQKMIYLHRRSLGKEGHSSSGLQGQGLSRVPFSNLHMILKNNFPGWTICSQPVHPASKKFMEQFGPRKLRMDEYWDMSRETGLRIDELPELEVGTIR